MYNNIAPFACPITFAFWMFGVDDSDVELKGENLLHNFLVHGVNCMGPVLDLFVISHPYHLEQGIYPMICAVLYTIYALVFQYLGWENHKGENFIYKQFNWIDDGNLIIFGKAMAAIIAVLMMHFLCCGLQFLTDKIYEHYKYNIKTKEVEIKLERRRTNKNREEVLEPV